MSDPLPISTFEGWEGVLHLSTLWDFERIRNFAIANMKSKLPVGSALVCLGRKYEVEDWVTRGFRYLASTDDSLSDGDVEAIGVPDALKIARVREGLLQTRTLLCSGGNNNCYQRYSTTSRLRDTASVNAQLTRHGLLKQKDRNGVLSFLGKVYLIV